MYSQLIIEPSSAHRRPDKRGRRLRAIHPSPLCLGFGCVSPRADFLRNASNNLERERELDGNRRLLHGGSELGIQLLHGRAEPPVALFAQTKQIRGLVCNCHRQQTSCSCSPNVDASPVDGILMFCAAREQSWLYIHIILWRKTKPTKVGCQDDGG